jgi:hypothetical protein
MITGVCMGEQITQWTAEKERSGGRTDGKGPRTLEEDRGQRTEDRGQRTDGGGHMGRWFFCTTE